MTLLEYVKSMDTTGTAVFSDEWTQETGIYVDMRQLERLENGRPMSIFYPFLEYYLGRDFPVPFGVDNIQYIDGENFERLNKIGIVIDKEVLNYESYPKYPYYQLRGRRVTEEQAFDIIRRTDWLFEFDLKTEDGIHLLNFSNHWFDWYHGWCHPSGIIGLNSNTSSYPDLDELIDAMVKLKYAFPYLDFVAAISCWSPAAFEEDLRIQIEKDVKDPDKKRAALDRLEYAEKLDFLDSIEIGIWLHDEAIEFMGPKRARQVYREYEEKYSEENRDIYVANYYKDNGIIPAGTEYLMRCIEANGLISDQALRESMERWRRFIEEHGQKAEQAFLRAVKYIFKKK